VLNRLPPDLAAGFKRSLLVARAQIDNRGGILASTDGEVLSYGRDHYNYVWPRDGALVALALQRAGYPEVAARYYQFCLRCLSREGFFWQRYHPDGSMGSSWHPWVREGRPELPLQEDETALVLFALEDYQRRHGDLEMVSSLYEGLVRRAADFLLRYRHAETGLPLPSFDLWEERRGIFTFTAASVYGALRGAGRLAHVFGDRGREQACLEAAAGLKEACARHLFSPELGRFLRGLYLDRKGEMQADPTMDSSLYGVFAWGLLPPTDPRVAGTMDAVASRLWVKTAIGGVARYTGDHFFRVSEDLESVPGNPWIVCTLWLAEWYIAAARSPADLDRPLALLRWAMERSLPGGVFPEQVHPYTGEPLSVAPLTWAHAAFVSTVLAYLDKSAALA